MQLFQYSSILPTPRSFTDDRPTLIVSWWCTLYALTIILFRVLGRYIRTEVFYPEDGLMVIAIIFLFTRMGLVHAVLIYGTNNTSIPDLGFSDEEIARRELGSKLVLATRITYAAFLWTVKFSTLTFLRTIALQAPPIYSRLFQALSLVFAAAFLSTFVAALGECHPFPLYYLFTNGQDSTCRHAYGHAITIGAANIITDLLLVIFPMAILLITNLPARRKFAIAVPLSLPLFSVALAFYRIPTVLSNYGSQQTRTLLASLEILVATAAANAGLLAGMLRNRGIKKSKYRSNERQHGRGGGRAETNIERNKTEHKRAWGSQEDLVVRERDESDDIGRDRDGNGAMELKPLEPAVEALDVESRGVRKPAPARLKMIQADETRDLEVCENYDGETASAQSGRSY